MPHQPTRLVLTFAALLALTSISLTHATEPASYMRVNRPDPQTVQLQIAVRKFVPKEGAGPTVYLTGVVHIGEDTYYKLLQKHLDQQSIVLFEGVGAPEFMQIPKNTIKSKIARSTSAVDFTAIMITWYKLKTSAYPDSLNQLFEYTNKNAPREAAYLKRALKDAWNTPLQYKRNDKSFTLTSLGSDAKPGGRDHAADIPFNHKKNVAPIAKEIGASNIQLLLAQALGLKFQLNAINYDRKNFIQSDLALGQIRTRLAGKAPKDTDFSKQMKQITDLLKGGNAGMGKMVQLFLGLIQTQPKMAAMIKLTMIEVLGELKGDLSKMKIPLPGMENLMKTLITDRNNIVLKDLKHYLKSKNPPKSISVFYGAGHMSHFEKSLTKDLKYKPDAEQWFTAFQINAEKDGISPAEMQQYQFMAKMALKQLKQMQQQQK